LNLLFHFIYVQAQINIEKAERVLGKVATAHRPPAEDSRPPETITDEERSMFRKLGLRIKAFLLLGNSILFIVFEWRGQ
jgi:hypothetical protein